MNLFPRAARSIVVLFSVIANPLVSAPGLAQAHLQTAADPQFTTEVREYKLTGTRHPVVLETSPRRVVYWRVRSIDAAGEPGPAGPVQAVEFGVSAG